MKHKLLIGLISILCSMESYTQNAAFKVKAYYSAPSEITVEIQNLVEEEMTILTDRVSVINFYKGSGQHKLKQLEFSLQATDSLNILVQIPFHKIYVAKYKVKDRRISKMDLEINYSYNFVSPPADTKWKKDLLEISVSAYAGQRRQIKESQRVKKEKISGDPVYDAPEVMPEFPGGEEALKHFLDKETSNYTYLSGDMGYVRVRCIIEKDGSITHPWVILGKDPHFQRAALEIIQRMPKWKPGTQSGKAVRTFYIIPILFRLV